MSTEGGYDDNGDANAIIPATPAPTTLFSADNGDASVAALADDLEYTLTVGQAIERIAESGRKAPSGRSIQRYCIEGRLAAQKIRTIFGSEWLINESSLLRLIEAEPIVIGDVGDAISTDVATSATPIAPPYTLRHPDTSANGDA